MGSFERFKTKTQFHLTQAARRRHRAGRLGREAADHRPGHRRRGRHPARPAGPGPSQRGRPGRGPPGVRGAASRRPLQLAARSAILVAVSPVLFVASGLHGDKVGVAVALLLLAIHLLIDWDALAPAPSAGGGPGGLGPGWVLARSLDQGLAGWLLGPGRPLVLAVAVVPAVVWVRRRPRRVYAAVGLVLLAPLALGPAWSPRDLVWPAVFGYLGDARWASIYAVAAGATLLWTSTWWGSGVPWHGGVDPATVPSGAVAALGLVSWVVLGSWAFLGWRTVTVESGSGMEEGSGVGSGRGSDVGAVDNGARPASRAATLPPGGAD